MANSKIVLLSDYTGSGYPNHDWDKECKTQIDLGKLHSPQLMEMAESLIYDIGDEVVPAIKNTREARVLAAVKRETSDFIDEIRKKYPSWAGPHGSAEGGYLMLRLKEQAEQSGRTPQEEADHIMKGKHVQPFSSQMQDLLEASAPEMNGQFLKEIAKALNYAFASGKSGIHFEASDLQNSGMLYDKLRDAEDSLPWSQNSFDKVWEKMQSPQGGLSGGNPLVRKVQALKTELPGFEVVLREDIEKGARLAAQEKKAQNALYKPFIAAVAQSPKARKLAEKIEELEQLRGQTEPQMNTMRLVFNRLWDRVHKRNTFSSMIEEIQEQSKQAHPPQLASHSKLGYDDSPDYDGKPAKTWKDIVFPGADEPRGR